MLHSKTGWKAKMTARLMNGEGGTEQNTKKGGGVERDTLISKENPLPCHWCSSLVFDVPLQEGKCSFLTLL